jgi:DUF1680 family protein
MLQPVPVSGVRFGPGFLGDRVRVNREATLPLEYEQCRRTGRLDAWSWRPGKPAPPHHFWDSDVAKWIEAAAWSLAAVPDPDLEARVERVIDQMAACQAEDGYLNSRFLLVEPDKRWTNLRDLHELYCAGHLMEAAVAWYEATGRRRFLDLMCRYADHIAAVFGPGPEQRRGYPGHEEIELALIRLYRATGERRYADLAAFFVNERGRQPHYFDLEARERGEDPGPPDPGKYRHHQAHLPVREQTTIEGHAVRAAYLFAGVADVAAVSGDETLLSACRRIWRNLTERRMYVTGGIGSTPQGERFTADYDLPNETAYAETCAAIALVFFADRMLRLERRGVYADVLERALYNGVLSGVSLDGTKFFYANPLAAYPPAHGSGLNRFPPERQEWFGCACCPPNLARLLASLGRYVYAAGPGELWVHLFAAGTLETELDGQPIRLEQQTRYPWEEAVEIRLTPAAPTDFTLCLRIPGWTRDPVLEINGVPVALDALTEQGYARVRRTWRAGDFLRLYLPMPVERVRAHPAVRHACGRVALQRGPVMYCLEEIDNGPDLAAIELPAEECFEVGFEDSPFPGVPVIRCLARRLDPTAWEGRLYRVGAEARPRTVPAAITAVPYCLWANRRPGEMIVWIREARG